MILQTPLSHTQLYRLQNIHIRQINTHYEKNPPKRQMYTPQKWNNPQSETILQSTHKRPPPLLYAHPLSTKTQTYHYKLETQYSSTIHMHQHTPHYLHQKNK